MAVKSDISSLLESDSPDIVSLVERILEHAVQDGSVSGAVSGQSMQFATPRFSQELSHQNATSLFRMILARLSKQASELTGEQFHPYQSESEFEWNGVELHQIVNNQLSNMSFTVERKSCQHPLSRLGASTNRR